MANVVASEPRSHALERRLRRRRQEARLRLRLVADCAVLQSHHASAAPAMPTQGSLRSELGLLRTLVEELREELAVLRREADLAGAPVAKTAAVVATVEKVAALDAKGKAGEEAATVAEAVGGGAKYAIMMETKGAVATLAVEGSVDEVLVAAAGMVVGMDSAMEREVLVQLGDAVVDPMDSSAVAPHQPLVEGPLLSGPGSAECETPASTPVLCRSCKGTGSGSVDWPRPSPTTFFGLPCALCRGSGLYGTPMVELLQLGGLMSQAENNGSRGLVVDWDRERRIYQVKLDDGRIVPVKSEHVRWPPPSG